jgi:anti-sigma B factor antagonist
LSALKTFQIIKQKDETENKVMLSGDLDLSVASDLAEELHPLIHQKDRALTLDLQGLHYIDSTGIGIIVSILKVRDAMKAPFTVTHIPPKIKRLFDLTGITKYMSVPSPQNS